MSERRYTADDVIALALAYHRHIGGNEQPMSPTGLELVHDGAMHNTRGTRWETQVGLMVRLVADGYNRRGSGKDKQLGTIYHEWALRHPRIDNPSALLAKAQRRGLLKLTRVDGKSRSQDLYHLTREGREWIQRRGDDISEETA